MDQNGALLLVIADQRMQIEYLKQRERELEDKLEKEIDSSNNQSEELEVEQNSGRIVLD